MCHIALAARFSTLDSRLHFVHSWLRSHQISVLVRIQRFKGSTIQSLNASSICLQNRKFRTKTPPGSISRAFSTNDLKRIFPDHGPVSNAAMKERPLALGRSADSCPIESGGGEPVQFDIEPVAGANGLDGFAVE